MAKALQMGKTSATGFFQLLVGVVAANVIGAIGTILIGRLLTPEEYGLYGIVLIPSTMIILFRDWGINSAITRYIAYFKASHQDEEIHDYVTAGLIFEVISGIAFSFLSLFLASFIATVIFNRPASASYIAIVSVSIVSGSLLVASQSGFVGFERMDFNSYTLILQAVVKAIVSPMLIFLGFSVLGAVIGYVASSVVAAAIGLILFYMTIRRSLGGKRTKSSNITGALRKMLSYGVPLSIGTILAGILSQILAFLIVPFASNQMYGDYAIAGNFAVLLTSFTTAISTVLFPAFAKLDLRNEHGLLKDVFASSIKYSSILVVPATMILMTLSGPIIGTLFGDKYVYGPFFLTLSVSGILLVVLGSLSVGSFLSGSGETGMIMKQNILTLIIGLPLGIFLIPTFGITGLIIASVFALVTGDLWMLYWIKKHYRATADLRCSAKIFLASAIAAFASYLSTMFLSTSDWLKLMVGLLTFIIVYVLDAPLVGAVSLSDINNLRVMLSGLGPFFKVINLPLKLAEKVAQVKSTIKE